MGDSVNHPPHYNTGKVEVIDIIELLYLNFHLGNAVKYIARAPFKGTQEEDIRKARWYIYRARDRNANYQRPPLLPEIEKYIATWIHEIPLDLDLRAALYLITIPVYNVSHDSFCLCLQAAAHSLDIYLEKITNGQSSDSN